MKGTFDLSGVKWKYKYTTDTGTVSNVYDPDTTKLEYNDGKVIRVEIDGPILSAITLSAIACRPASSIPNRLPSGAKYL